MSTKNFLDQRADFLFLENYELLVNEFQIHVFFQRFADSLKNLFQRESQKFYLERGEAEGGIPYFYVQLLGQKGWLFEQKKDGWSGFLSDKIVSQDLLTRGQEPWEVVTLWAPQIKGASPKVSSLLLGEDQLVSYPVYEMIFLSKYVFL